MELVEMATKLEQAFAAAVNLAQGVTQNAYAAALAAYAPNGFGVPANFATYIAALVTADTAFWASVNTAANTNGISPTAVDDAYQFYPNTTATILT
jgi:hypothetical protein